MKTKQKINDLIQVQNNLIHRTFKELNNSFEDYFIKGLKRKGFEFKHKIELESFIKERCRCEDMLHLKEKVYYVDDVPFLLYKYRDEPLIATSITDKEYKITADIGEYAYL